MEKSKSNCHMWVLSWNNLLKKTKVRISKLIYSDHDNEWPQGRVRFVSSQTLHLISNRT